MMNKHRQQTLLGQQGKKLLHQTINLYELRTLLLILLLFQATGANTEVKDICMGEEFEVLCASDEVVITHSALYGRMADGRCLASAEFGQLGCENDVLHLVDRWCSGHQSCKFFVPNKLFDEHNEKCSRDLRAYLRISYSCLKVVHSDANECSNAHPIPLLESEGFISSHVTKTTGCGSVQSPWRMEAQPGQVIQISLIDFSAQKVLNRLESNSCENVYGYIVEKELGINRTVCNSEERDSTVYTSKSNIVEMQLTSDMAAKDTFYMFHYEFTGCPDLTPPAHAWYTRDGSAALIGCKNSDIMWQLECTGNIWQGIVGNCSDPAILDALRSTWMTDFKIALISAIVGLVLIIVIIIVTVAMCYLKRKRRRRTTQLPHPGDSKNASGYATNPYYQPFTYDWTPASNPESKTYVPRNRSELCQISTQNELNLARSRSNQEQTKPAEDRNLHIWETPLPDPSGTPTTTSQKQCSCKRKKSNNFDSLGSNTSNTCRSVDKVQGDTGSRKSSSGHYSSNEGLRNSVGSNGTIHSSQ